MVVSSRTGRLPITGDAVETGITDGLPLGEVTDCWLLVTTVVSSVAVREREIICAYYAANSFVLSLRTSAENSATLFPAPRPPRLSSRALTGTAGLQVHGRRVARVKERHGRRRRERVDAVQERLVVQVVQGTVRLPRLVCRSEQDRSTDELVLDCASPETAALRLDLMRGTGRERRVSEEREARDAAQERE